MNFDFKKSFGQNFLKDNNITEGIASAIDYKDNNLVIEIGPGAGALTKKMLPKVDRAILYEIDTRLKEILDVELKEFNNYELIFGDFLEKNVKSYLAKYKYDNLYVVANLPYYVTTPIISKIIEDDIQAKEIVIMIQKEVADRLSAEVGTKEYGGLSVFLNYFYDIKKLFNVSRNCFVPKPNVDSAVIKMIRKDNREHLKDINHFSKLVKDSFRFKRKTIKNNLNEYDMDIVSSVLNKYGFSVTDRSEKLPYNVFVELSNELIK